MKKTIILFLILNILTCFLKVNAQNDFTGNWNSSSSDFTLSIKQIKNKITGSHCSILQNGNRIDCATDERTIRGTIHGDSILVVFKSTYSMKSGTAVIKRINDAQIKWEITKKPVGEFYIPTTAILKKE